MCWRAAIVLRACGFVRQYWLHSRAMHYKATGSISGEILLLCPYHTPTSLPAMIRIDVLSGAARLSSWNCESKSSSHSFQGAGLLSLLSTWWSAFYVLVCFLHEGLLPRKLTGDACRVEKLQERVEELKPFVPRCEKLEFCDLLECLVIYILSLLYMMQLRVIDEYSATSPTCILPCSTMAVSLHNWQCSQGGATAGKGPGTRAVCTTVRKSNSL